MTAGRGIVHSERTPLENRRRASRLHALQLWVALPIPLEESEPSFHHHPGESLPQVDVGSVRVRVLAGAAYGVVSPVGTSSLLFYADAAMPAGSELPLPREHAERAVYVVDGAVECDAEHAESGRMLVFASGTRIVLRAKAGARIVLIGGAPLAGERHMLWNFVSSSQQRLDQAKKDWKEGRFPRVPGDDVEVVPFPD
jgi:redox-sensitive bicupin YhaK (pirin superfamily)